MKSFSPHTPLIPLTTPFEDSTLTWENAYPRPQLRRERWINLCGMWQLSVTARPGGPLASADMQNAEPVGDIHVPFPPESRLSGISRTLQPGEIWVYSTTFPAPALPKGGRLLLHLPPIDQRSAVVLNGHAFPERISAVHGSTIDITDVLQDGENELRILADDPLDSDIPYGKQRKKRGGMWYTPTSGIRGQVWLEPLPARHITDIRILPTLDSVTFHVKSSAAGDDAASYVLRYTSDGEERAVSFSCECVTIHIDNPHLWSPEDPFVYRFTLQFGEDEISSYFALREIRCERRGTRTCMTLNGKPYYFHGLLDQGYYPDGIDLPASPEGYLYDIQTMKQLGFNMLRKHIKVENPYFYYYCDLHGMPVFQDMVNNGRYRFLFDTALPTVGIRRQIPQRVSASQRENFLSAAKETVSALYNHPCVVYYTIFNEGWGQFDADGVYRTLKPLDPSRVWDTTSGWFPGTESDVTSEHVYFRALDLHAEPDRPLVLSEFGGYACAIPEHCANPKKRYGYRALNSPAALTAALEQLYLGEVRAMIGRGLCASVLTQVSDVEDEVNGLLTYDRRVLKVDPAVMRAIADALREPFLQTWENHNETDPTV